MTVLIEDSEEIPCSHCAVMRKTFILVAVSAVLPIVIFAAVLLLVAAGRFNAPLESVTGVVTEFVLVLLYVQLSVATSVLILGFVKRPGMRYYYWYLIFHILTIFAIMIATLILTMSNEAYVLSTILGLIGSAYVMYCCMYVNIILKCLRRIS